jgi:hypothetical protein
MIQCNKYRRHIFYVPDKATSGGTGDPGAGQGGAREGEGAASEIDPFAGMDLNDLDPDARKIIEAGQKQFASLQKQLAEQRQATEAQEREKRKFQSEFDGLRAQLQKQLNGDAPQGTPVDQARASHLLKFTKILMDRNVPEAQAKVQAEIMLDMMTDFGTSLKGEIGRDLAPFAGSVIQREAEAAWTTATQPHNDKVGALQIKEVAEQTWSQVQLMVQNGQQVTPDIIKNLSGMAYLKHLEAGGAAAPAVEPPQPPTMSQPPTLPSMGRSTYPGAGAAPFRPPVFDPHAAKTVLDPATDAALQTVMSKWDVKPKSYRGK